jgi:MFS family permease
MVIFATSAVLSPIIGKIASKLNIQPILYVLYILIIAISVYLLLWKSTPQTIYNLFILSICFGIVDSINTPQPRAIYAILFNPNVAFSAYSFFHGIGFLSGFLISTFTCTFVKIYILIGLACLCIISDTVRVLLHRNRVKHSEAVNYLDQIDGQFSMRTHL